jgi:hypothetical protein
LLSHNIDKFVVEEVSCWKDLLRMIKRETHEDVAYVDWELTKEITSHIIWKIMIVRVY